MPYSFRYVTRDLLYAQSHRPIAGHTIRPLITQLYRHGPLGESGPAQGRFEPPTCRSTVEHANLLYPGSSRGGGVFFRN